MGNGRSAVSCFPSLCAGVDVMQGPLWEEFEHGSDVGLRVRGRSLPELFDNAARGMIELMLEPGGVRPRQQRRIEARADDVEGLLVGWLGEVVFAFDADGFSPARARVERLEAGMVEGTLCGEPFDHERHVVRNAIKAVTWHNLKVERQGELYCVSIVFDV